ncbi:MAG TPA: hypothetical protein VFM55_15230 [Micromonosporaceae bacterium]|nr:hypothetical protein [Micromonosporaceae bacterium]
MSVRAYAAHLGVTVATVSNWSSRGARAHLRTETQQLLDIDLARAPAGVHERFEAILAGTSDGRATVAPGVLGPAEVFATPGTAGFPGTGIDGGVVTAAMRAFRVADSRIGGAPLYAAVIAYLKSHVGPRLVDGTDETSTPDAFCAAASMLEMAGWMAHDRGDDDTALAHFSRALSFTAVGDDRHLRAHVLGSMSHLAAHLRRPHETIQLAQRGQDVLRDAPPHPPLMARLLALEARGAAGLGDLAKPLVLLAQAEAELAKAVSLGLPPTPWVSHYDEASLASDAGRCLRRLGDLAETRRQAERIIGLRPAQRARSRGLGQLMLANVLVAQGVVDEASAVTARALDSGLPLHSAPVARGLRTLGLALAPHKASAAVGEVHARLTETLDQQSIWAGNPGSSGTGLRT